MYRGTGTVNGVDGYTFMLSAVDGQLPGGGGVDKFRIQIWAPGDGLYYDSQAGSDKDANPTTAISGGSIVIHKAKTK
jgi:hypothetical protein